MNVTSEQTPGQVVRDALVELVQLREVKEEIARRYSAMYDPPVAIRDQETQLLLMNRLMCDCQRYEARKDAAWSRARVALLATGGWQSLVLEEETT